MIEKVDMLQFFKKPGSYYEILNVPPSTTNRVVRDSYKTLMTALENDKKISPRMKVLRQRLLNEAYAALRNEDGRNRYNRLLLCSLGKPRGLAVKAENDNKKSGIEHTFWGKLGEFISHSKIETAKKKEQDHG